MTAMEMATELGERVKQELPNLPIPSLQIPSLPLPIRKPAPKKRSKLGMLSVVALCVGIAYGLYRMMRPAKDTPTATPSTPRAEPTESAQATVRSA